MTEDQYRVALYRQGAEIEFIYGKDPVKLRGRAVKKLKKELFCCKPLKAVLEIKVGSLGKNHSLWRTVEIVPAEP